MDKKLVNAINDQIKAEFDSEYIYLGMAAWALKEGYEGAAKFMFIQADEERFHAMKFIKFLGEMDEKIVIPAVDKPETKFESLQEILEKAYEHEKYVTKRIHNLVKLSDEVGDPATNDFLSWYVAEQIEEENSFRNVLKKLKITGAKGHALLMIDQQLGQRAPFTPPTDAEE